ncbi:hypothetical protein AAMO2058_000677400 [Amorphochlora amoebiformis]
MGQGQQSTFDSLDSKNSSSVEPSPLPVDELIRKYTRSEKIGKRRAQTFAKDLIQWHVDKKSISQNVDMNREVFRILNLLDVQGNGKISIFSLKTQVAADLITKYRFPGGRKRTGHVIHSIIPSLEFKTIDLIVSYTSDWGFHPGHYIGYGVRNGFWRNGWGYETFNRAEPHKLHASSHTAKGDGISHWSCCGNVDKNDSLCIATPPPPSRRSKAASPVTRTYQYNPPQPVHTTTPKMDTRKTSGASGPQLLIFQSLEESVSVGADTREQSSFRFSVSTSKPPTST